MGVGRLVPVLTARSIVKFDAEKRAERGERWRRVALAAAKQSKRAIGPARRATLPRLRTRWPSSPTTTWCSSRGRRRRSPARACATRWPLQVRLREGARVAIVAGPEGGLAPEEVAALERVGGVVVTLGTTILRVGHGGRRLQRARRPRAWRARELLVSAPVSATRVVAVAVHTLGCKVNRVESDSIAAELLGKGAQLVAESDAEVIVVNTCTVTGEADAKARKAVRQALRAPREPVVVVTGCLAALDAGCAPVARRAGRGRGGQGTGSPARRASCWNWTPVPAVTATRPSFAQARGSARGRC